MTKFIIKTMIKNLSVILILFMTVSGAQAAISGATVVTNTGSSDRTLISTNGTFNISFTESLATNYMNISFPSGFTHSALEAENITNNTGGAMTILKSGTWVNITYTAKAAGAIFFNFTSNVKSTATAGNYNINISGNYTNLSITAPTSIPIYVRDPAYPFFVKSNNTNFTIGTETFAAGTTTIPLTGIGNSNFTLYSPNSTQTNITSGWKATNASIVKSQYTSGTTPNNTIYIHVDSTITNPVITVSPLTSANLPSALIAGGVISITLIIYLIRRRTK